jgi:hypothetical protein
MCRQNAQLVMLNLAVHVLTFDWAFSKRMVFWVRSYVEGAYIIDIWKKCYSSLLLGRDTRVI